MKIEILDRWDNSVIYSCEAKDKNEAVSLAIRNKINLSGANLSRANLSGADLSRANLSGANLSGADLSRADLSRANLSGAYLSRADLSRANLSGANLSGANLSGADLSRANLSGANLSGANLSGANLSHIKINDKELQILVNQRIITGEGDLIVYKKLQDNIIVKLLIPKEAKRLGGLIGRKCRAEYAKVIEGEGFSLTNQYEKVLYQKNKTVYPDKFDPNPLVECSNGIHFFLTRQEAEDFSM